VNRRRTRLLIVDDEPLVLRSLARVLHDFDVTTLSSPREALGRLSSGDSWDIILADVMIPEMNGVEFARRAVQVCPAVAGHIAVMTGGTCSPVIRNRLEQSKFPAIGKPFDFDALRAVLATLTPGRPPPDRW
jgi:CheY-like chemotaxis protein